MTCILRDYHHCPENAQGAVVAIGNFDGLHLGHQAVIQAMLSTAKKMKAPAAVMSFYPHPRHFFNPGKPPIRLQRLHQKLRLLEQWGVEILYLLHFTRRFSQLSARAFAEQVLHRHLNARHIVTGHDFFYGQGRSGSPDILQKDCADLSIGCTVVKEIEVNGIRSSSSAIRSLLRDGLLDEVEHQLGRLYAVEGRVRHGDKRGRTIGIPTANLTLERLCLPAFGAYIAEAWVDGTPHPAVANIGLRPTVGGTTPLLEAHLLDYDGDLYGQRLEVCLHRFLRPETQFPGLDALRAQINQDIAAARDYFKQGFLHVSGS